MTSQEELLAGLALRAVVERYAVAVDRGDGALFAAQFTDDGILESPRGRFEGRVELAAVPPMMKQLYDRTHHGVVGVTPVFDSASAVCETYAYARHFYRDSSGCGQCYEMTIRYEDAFRRANGVWLIARRVLVLVGDATYPTGRRFGAAPETAS